jgi:hypothetical protein
MYWIWQQNLIKLLQYDHLLHIQNPTVPLFHFRGQPQHVVEILSPPPMLLQHRQSMNHDEQISPRSSGLVDNNNVHRPDFGQVIDVNLSSWTEIYPTGT